MVSNVTSLTGNGLKDWLIQRLTAVYFAAYLLFILGYFLLHPDMTYPQWSHLFTNLWFEIATTIALLTFSLHAWIGLWTVSTDYMKCTVIRVTFQSLLMVWLLGQFIWGLTIIWGPRPW